MDRLTNLIKLWLTVWLSLSWYLSPKYAVSIRLRYLNILSRRSCPVVISVTSCINSCLSRSKILTWRDLTLDMQRRHPITLLLRPLEPKLVELLLFCFGWWWSPLLAAAPHWPLTSSGDPLVSFHRSAQNLVF